MKKLIYILSIAAVASLTVLSCQKEQEVNPRTPSPAEVADCYGVYFPTQEASGDHVYSPVEDPVLEITVARTNENGAITVPVKTLFSEDVFESDEIKFADGQKETTIKVRFDKAVEGTKYTASFVIEDPQYASMYNSNPIGLDFSVMRVEMLDWVKPGTTEPAVITLNEGWWGEVHMAKMKYYEVNGIRTCTIYSIEEGNGIWGDTQDITLQFTWYTKDSNEAGYNFLEVQKQYFGFDYDDWASKPLAQATNPVFVYDYPWYWIERGYSWGDGNMQDNWLAEAKTTGQIDGSYPVGYYDGNGGFYFNLRYYIPGLGGFSPDPYEFVAISEGFIRVDYSFEVETDYPSNGKSPIYLEAGIDVAGIKYAIYEGELTATQVANKAAAIEDGTDASVTFTDFEIDEEEAVKYATLEVAPEATGLYTFVAIALDENGEVQNTGSVCFNYVSAEDEEEYAVDMYVFTEDTPARYASYHDYDSFAFGIVGKELTDVHMGIFKFDDVAKDPDTYFDAVKLDEKGEYAVSEEILAKINGEGGYYDIATQMPAKTELIVLVWATNGSLEAFDFDTYTTKPLPYVWNSLGKGILTDGFFVSLFSRPDYTVACDVYEEATTPGLYMITNYQLPLVAQFFGITEEEMLPYEGGNWKVTELVIDATDPEAVFIDDQDYGVCVNSDYGFVLIGADPVGTLADGAITFPARKMYAGIAGTWYYGNNDGTFKITLPSVGLAAPAISPASAGGNVKTNFVMARDAKVYDKPVVKFERDPQPVKVSCDVNYTRKEKNTEKKVLVSNKGFEVR